MSMDERIRFLLRAATRAEGEGDQRIARIFRRMAEDARPLDVSELVPELHFHLGWSAE
jgi:hypothetical protein